MASSVRGLTSVSLLFAFSALRRPLLMSDNQMPTTSNSEARPVDAPPVKAATDFQIAFVEKRAQALGKSIRCTVCANASIEESNSEVAALLRRLVREKLAEGKTETEVMKELSDVYGDSVLYAPRLDVYTSVLYAAPAIAAVIAVLLLVRSYGNRRTTRLKFRAADMLLQELPITQRELAVFRALFKIPRR